MPTDLKIPSLSDVEWAKYNTKIKYFRSKLFAHQNQIIGLF